MFEWRNIFGQDTTNDLIKGVEYLFDRFIGLLIDDLDIGRTEWGTANILNDKNSKSLVAVAVVRGGTVGDETAAGTLVAGRLQAERINTAVVSKQKSRKKVLRISPPCQPKTD
jgi:hypothetical protein